MKIRAIFTLISAIAGFLFGGFTDIAQATELEITNIRVGQGDATLIQGPTLADGSRVNVLFDAGDRKSRDAGNIIRAVLAKKKIRTLDYVIISHFDADHIGGIAFGPNHGRSFILGFNDEPGADGDDDGDGQIGWLDGFKCEKPDPDELGRGDDIRVLNWVDRGDVARKKNKGIAKYLAFTEAMGKRIRLDTQDEIDTYEIDLGLGATMKSMAGNGWVRGQIKKVSSVNTENERSLSFLVNYKQFDFLVSGDMIGRSYGSENAKVEEAVGRALKEEGVMLEVLHVNHHGGNNGSSAEFLNLVKPRIAVISAGNGNSHKHPHNDVLKRLHDAGVDRVIQTAWGRTANRVPDDVRNIHAIYQSDVSIKSDGRTYDIFTSRSFLTNRNKQPARKLSRVDCT